MANQYKQFEEELNNLKLGAIRVMSEIKKLDNKMNGSENEITLEQYLYSALEMQQDREQEKIESIMQKHEKEKEEMRKEFDKTRKEFDNVKKMLWSIIITILIGIFGGLFWFFNNYDIAGISQEVNTGNANYLYGDGTLVNGEADN